MQEPYEQQVSLTDYLRVLYRGRWIIAITFLITVLTTAFFTFTAEPVYQASATVMIKEEGGVSDVLFGGVAGALRRDTEINNQVQILKSRTLAEEVIKRLRQSEHAKELRVLGNLPEDVRRKFNPISAAAGLVSGIMGGGDDGKQGPAGEEALVVALAERLREKVKVTPVRNTDMIEIKFEAPSPFEAAFVTNTIAQTYREEDTRWSRAEVSQVKEFLEQQLPKIREDLEATEERLRKYQEEQDVFALDRETEKLVENISEVEALYHAALTDLQACQKRLAYVDSILQVSRTQIDVDAIASQPYLEQIRRQIAQKEIERATLVSNLLDQGLYRENDPALSQIDRELNELKAKFREEVAKLAATQMPDPLGVSNQVLQRKIELEAELRSLRPKVESLQRLRQEYNRRLESIPTKALELARLKRAALVNEKIFTMMQEKYEESRITEVGQLGKVRIVDPAREPIFPVKPKKRLNLMLAGIIGLMLGVGIAFVIEYIDNTVRSPDEVERLGLPLLGTVPVIEVEEEREKVRLHPSANGDAEAWELSSRLVAHFRPKSPISEAYRTVRTNIQYSRPDQTPRVLLVTSPGPGEGKSTTVANLAITFAQLGNRTLLVDADLRRPILHRIFGIDRNTGLTNCIVGRESLENVVRPTPIENLYVIACGPLPPNPAEILGSDSMKHLLKRMAEEYDAVLLDSPPILAVTDSLVLSTEVDGVVLVVRAGQTDRQAALRGFASLEKVGGKILGVLLNGIRVESVYGSYYYYYHYYYYTREGERKVRRKKRKRTHY
ncbi:MAG: polysaccharide biosynthesis tyrosine autokinase [candidate division KSB1 bacterium]|nr:polysaccharide biosynthesis tyrosine autokinase [candidate division KSB1 bacterium]